ncbi:D-glycerate 2-kinase (EC [Olavius algarvensis associated proteobacterium Delta 3]|nr:D-glycerate 2-kinase (EC [Olavius algarvensis associated proteobacterium Delta 3]
MVTRSSTRRNMRSDGEHIFLAGVAAVRADAAVFEHCRRKADRLYVGDDGFDVNRFRRIFVVGAGKASAAMARALEHILPTEISGGVVSVKYEHTAVLKTVRQVEAGHPVPDAHGEKAAQSIIELVQQAEASDLVLCLISGGGSALLPLPAPGITLADKQEMIRQLLACGATIHEINTLRKHTSAIKGGRLAEAAYPATLISLILSDVIGDDLDVIASGPTVPDTSTFQDALAIVHTYRLDEKLPKPILEHLEAGHDGHLPETPKTGHHAFERTVNLIIGSNMQAIRAAEQEARNRGYHCLILSSLVEGETREAARFHGAIAREILNSGHPIPKPACLISGGETTVTLKGNGIGGRNLEFALAAAIDIAEHDGIVILSGGTDGTDGPTPAAGATVDHNTVKKAAAVGLDAREFLERNNSYPFFEQLGDLIITGPTDTNVMDLRIVLVR